MTAKLSMANGYFEMFLFFFFVCVFAACRFPRVSVLFGWAYLKPVLLEASPGPSVKREFALPPGDLPKNFQRSLRIFRRPDEEKPEAKPRKRKGPA